MIQFNNVYNKKKVLITGNTGFKGSWLTIWLKQLGAEVYGISIDIPSQPSNFLVSKLDEVIKTKFIDINNLESLNEEIKYIQPDFIFHLAAQPIVFDSYKNPINTFNTNIIGTCNILESVRHLTKNCVVILITSDKCYENVEWIWGYKETDHLGGKDPYSASKAAAEIVIHSYYESFFKKSNNIRIASVRAGNVIGGGDWADSRIIPDAIRSWSENLTLQIRSPKSTRPWQHVLEPLSGYLFLGQQLFNNINLSGEAFNFGPNDLSNFTVEELLIEMSIHWENVKWEVITNLNNINEANLLKLNCDKSSTLLKWNSNMNFKQTIQFLTEWYKKYYFDKSINMYDFTRDQINEYVRIAKINNKAWVV